MFETMRKVIVTLFGLVLLFVFIWLLHYNYKLIDYPFTGDYREGAMLVVTDLLLKGQNPLDMAYMPMATNMYGIVCPLITYPLAKLTGDLLLAHRLISCLCILATCIMLFIVMARKKIGLTYIFSAIVILYASLLYRQTSEARPDALGLLLFILSIFIPYLLRYSLLSLFVSIILGIIAFYTKQYFILSCVYIGSYLFLFISKKMAVFYTLTFTLLFSLSIIVVNYELNTYFLNTICTYNGMPLSYSYLWAQLKRYFFVNAGLLFIIAAYTVNLLRSKQWSGISAESFNISAFHKPFVDIECPLSLYCLILSSIVVCLALGRNYGAWMTYFYQLITPFLLVVVFGLIASAQNMDGFLQSKRIQYGYVFIIACILLSLYRSCFALSSAPKDADILTWRDIEEKVVSHKNILNSPAIASLLVKHNKPVYDAGLTAGWKNIDCSRAIFTRFLPAAEAVRNCWTKYLESLDSQASQQKFDLIVLTDDGEDNFVSRDILEKYYQKTDSKSVYMYHTTQSWKLSFWEPRKR